MIYYWLAQFVLPNDNFLVCNYHHYQYGQSNDQDLVASPCHPESPQMKIAIGYTLECHDHHSGDNAHISCCSILSSWQSMCGVLWCVTARVLLGSLLRATNIHKIYYSLTSVGQNELFYYHRNRIGRTNLLGVSILRGIVQQASRNAYLKYRAFCLKSVSVSYINYTRNTGVTV